MESARNSDKKRLAGRVRLCGVERLHGVEAAMRGVSGTWLFLLTGALLVVGLAALGVDCRLAQWLAEGRCPKSLDQFLARAELLGRGECVLLVALIVYQLDASRRWAAAWVLACPLLSGLAADLVKLSIARVRPHNFDFAGDVWSTFGGWFPLTSAGSAGQSFPSAHAATAVGLAVALAWLYPAGKRVFVVLAVLVACQRVESGAHYLSDVLCGAAVGCAVAGGCLKAVGQVPNLSGKRLSRRDFQSDRLEICPAISDPRHTRPRPGSVSSWPRSLR
jgi:membrane-associated phospholipid phosphatase